MKGARAIRQPAATPEPATPTQPPGPLRSPSSTSSSPRVAATLRRGSTGRFNLVFKHDSYSGAVAIQAVGPNDAEEDGRGAVHENDFVARVNGVETAGLTLPEVQRLVGESKGELALELERPEDGESYGESETETEDEDDTRTVQETPPPQIRIARPDEPRIMVARQDDVATTAKPKLASQLAVLAVGGTIDKDYPRAHSGYAFEICDPAAERMLASMPFLNVDWRVESVCQKDSTELTDTDRELLVAAVQRAPEDRIVVTHGTDTMIQTALFLHNSGAASSKSVAFIGAMKPERFKDSDASFNLGAAVAATAILPPGQVVLAMGGNVVNCTTAERDLQTGLFVSKARPKMRPPKRQGWRRAAQKARAEAEAASGPASEPAMLVGARAAARAALAAKALSAAPTAAPEARAEATPSPAPVIGTVLDLGAGVGLEEQESMI